MSRFVVLLRPTGLPVLAADRRKYSLSRQVGYPMEHGTTWFMAEGIAVGISGPVDHQLTGLGPVIVRTQLLLGVGDVRLDNRGEISVLVTGSTRFDGPDLALVLQAIRSHGPSIIAHLLGDFVFVVWLPSARRLIAARDATGVKPLYYAAKGDLFAVSSSSSLLADGEDYDVEYIADYLGDGITSFSRSPFAGVSALPTGTMLLHENGRLTVTRFWSPEAFPVDGQRSRRVEEDCDHFLALFADSLRLRIGSRSDVWALLSGGLDSSSIVCLAHQLSVQGRVPTELAGAVTAIDTLGDGDERPYVDAVVGHCHIRHEVVADTWLWQEDGLPPPVTDTPSPQYPFFARDRRLAELVRHGGGRVLLSGLGADHYLTGTPLFIADLVAGGSFRSACRAAFDWATSTRTSFWRSFWRYGLLPLLPGPAYRRLTRLRDTSVPWIRPSFARHFDLQSRSLTWRVAAAPRGRKYQADIALATGVLGFGYDASVLFTSFDLRCPFLYRPLLEFCLALPPALRTRPKASKWILRQTMRGILPEEVRTRTGKGSVDGRIQWSLVRAMPRIAWLLTDPIVADMGWVEPRRLWAALAEVTRGDGSHCAAILRTLALETWLRVRAGMWISLQSDTLARTAPRAVTDHGRQIQTSTSVISDAGHSGQHSGA